MTATSDPHSDPHTTPEGDQEKQSFGALISAITQQLSMLVRGEIELAQVQLKAKLTKLGIGGAFFAIAGVLALYLLGLLFLGSVWAFGLIMPLWAAFFTVSGILLLIIVVLLLLGLNEMKKSKEYTVDPKTGLKETADAAKRGFKNE